MKIAHIALAIICAGLSACSKGTSQMHHYAMKDGYSYGYELILTAEQKEAGTAANPLVMFQYSGQKGSVYQVSHIIDDMNIEVLECEAPCKFIKTNVHTAGIGMGESEIIKSVPNMLGYLVLHDAISGKLDQFVGEENGQLYVAWYGEQAEPEKTFVKRSM